MPELFSFTSKGEKTVSWEEWEKDATVVAEKRNGWSGYEAREDFLQTLWQSLIYGPSLYFEWLQQLSFRVYPDANHSANNVMVDQMIINRHVEVVWSRNSATGLSGGYTLSAWEKEDTGVVFDPTSSDYLKTYASFLTGYFDSLFRSRGEYLFPFLFGRIATVTLDKSGVFIDEDPTLIPGEADVLKLVRDLNQRNADSLHSKVMEVLFRDKPEPWLRAKQIQALLRRKPIGSVQTERNWLLLFFRKISEYYPALKSFEWNQYAEYNDSWMEFYLGEILINDGLRCNFYEIQLDYRIEEPDSWKVIADDPSDWDTDEAEKQKKVIRGLGSYAAGEIEQIEKGCEAMILLLRAIYDELSPHYFMYLTGNKTTVTLGYDGITIRTIENPS